MFSWWCVWVSVRRYFGFVWGATGFFNAMMQKFYFVFAAALLHKVDLVMLSMQKMKFDSRRNKRLGGGSFHNAFRSQFTTRPYFLNSQRDGSIRNATRR